MTTSHRTRRGWTVALLVLLGSAASPRPAPAQGAPSAAADDAHPDERPTREAASSFLSWFRELMNTMPGWVASVEREKLLDQLRALNTDLFWVRDRKSLFLSQMEAGVLDADEGARVLDSLNARVREMGVRVQKVGSRLNAQQRAGGDSVARRLSDAAGARKVWLSELEQAQSRKDSARVRALLNDGRRTVAVLDSAGGALGALIQKLGGS